MVVLLGLLGGLAPALLVQRDVLANDIHELCEGLGRRSCGFVTRLSRLLSPGLGQLLYLPILQYDGVPNYAHLVVQLLFLRGGNELFVGGELRRKSFLGLRQRLFLSLLASYRLLNHMAKGGAAGFIGRGPDRGQRISGRQPVGAQVVGIELDPGDLQ